MKADYLNNACLKTNASSTAGLVQMQNIVQIIVALLPITSVIILCILILRRRTHKKKRYTVSITLVSIIGVFSCIIYYFVAFAPVTGGGNSVPSIFKGRVTISSYTIYKSGGFAVNFKFTPENAMQYRIEHSIQLRSPIQNFFTRKMLHIRYSHLITWIKPIKPLTVSLQSICFSNKPAAELKQFIIKNNLIPGVSRQTTIKEIINPAALFFPNIDWLLTDIHCPS